MIILRWHGVFDRNGVRSEQDMDFSGSDAWDVTAQVREYIESMDDVGFELIENALTNTGILKGDQNGQT